MLDQCWAAVYDGGPTLNQQWPNVLFLLGFSLWPSVIFAATKLKSHQAGGRVGVMVRM